MTGVCSRALPLAYRNGRTAQRLLGGQRAWTSGVDFHFMAVLASLGPDSDATSYDRRDDRRTEYASRSVKHIHYEGSGCHV